MSKLRMMMKQANLSLWSKICFKKAINGIFLAIFLSISTSNLHGQNLTEAFLFSAVSGTYTPTTGQTLLIGQSIDDQVTGAINIGFTFNYDGQNFTQFVASSNGWLSFNTTITDAYLTNNLAAPTARPIIAPLWDNLEADNTGGQKYENNV